LYIIYLLYIIYIYLLYIFIYLLYIIYIYCIYLYIYCILFIYIYCIYLYIYCILYIFILYIYIFIVYYLYIYCIYLYIYCILYIFILYIYIFIVYYLYIFIVCIVVRYNCTKCFVWRETWRTEFVEPCLYVCRCRLTQFCISGWYRKISTSTWYVLFDLKCGGSKGNFTEVAIRLLLTRKDQSIKVTNDSTQHSTNGFNSDLILVVCFIIVWQCHWAVWRKGLTVSHRVAVSLGCLTEGADSVTSCDSVTGLSDRRGWQCHIVSHRVAMSLGCLTEGADSVTSCGSVTGLSDGRGWQNDVNPYPANAENMVSS